MKKFFILVKKEVRELLTPQTLVPLVVVVLVFVFIGKTIGRESAKNAASQPVAVIDLDDSQTSRSIIEILGQNGLSVEKSNQSVDAAVKEAPNKNQKAVLVFPAGLEESIKNLNPKKIEVHSIFNNFSVLGSRSGQMISAALAIANEKISDEILAQSGAATNLQAAKRPIQVDDFTVVGGRQAHVNPNAVAGFISSQTTFIPIILFLVIVFASQLIATSIASEKENKTLETLLSSPINRNAIVAAKLVGAGIVALLTAVVYLFGMRYYINGLTATTGMQTSSDAATKAAMDQLGLAFGTGDYVLLGLSLFFGILVALSLAIILGSFAEDSKSAQGVIAPLMVLVLVPYFLTMFLDISSLSQTMRYFVYLIPFSHPFLAAPNILLHQTQNVWYGIGYMAVLFLVFVFLASKLFVSERIFTMKISFKKK